MQQISDWRELIGLQSSPGRGEWLGKARIQMRSNGQASQLKKGVREETGVCSTPSDIYRDLYLRGLSRRF
jgi:hypothetical protein